MTLRSLRLLVALSSSALAVAACSGGGGGGGDDDDDDGAGFDDDGGTGTGTLRINAALEKDAEGLFSVRVVVLDGANAPVGGATVVLRTPEQGDVTLVEEPPFGAYELAPAASIDYAEGFGLEVDAGATGNATGIGFDAPSPTDITSPQNQDTVPLDADLVVTWDGSGATEHRLELVINDYDSGWTDGDPGTFTIPAAEMQTSGTESLTVRRRKEMAITSGVAGSTFTATLEDELPTIAVQ